jgi:NADH dehydrogenase
MRILVTGASGFIGSHVARGASRRGDHVRCLVRLTSDRSLLGTAPVEIAIGDVTDADSMRRAATGVDAVVHCAAATSETSPDYASSHRTNVLGTKNLVAACERAHVEKLVVISTQSANEQNRSAYGKTKLEAERIVEASSLAYTILRPSTVYGPGARGLFAKMQRYVATLPLVPVIGSGRQRFRPIYVGDVVQAVLACLETERAIRQTYDLGGLDGVSFGQFIDGIGDALGRRRPQLRVPVPVCLGVARVFSFVPNPPLTVDNIIGVTQMSECDISKAREDFGFVPISFREGIEILRRHGFDGPAAGGEHGVG